MTPVKASVPDDPRDRPDIVNGDDAENGGDHLTDHRRRPDLKFPGLPDDNKKG
jgi:hypothetical protein